MTHELILFAHCPDCHVGEPDDSTSRHDVYLYEFPATVELECRECGGCRKATRDELLELCGLQNSIERCAGNELDEMDRREKAEVRADVE